MIRPAEKIGVKLVRGMQDSGTLRAGDKLPALGALVLG